MSPDYRPQWTGAPDALFPARRPYLGEFDV